MRPRHIAAVALVLGLTVAGFVVARMLAERDARDHSEQRVKIAAAHIRSRVAVATSLTESLRRVMSDKGATGVTNDQFTRNALRWLSPAELPAAAWAEEVQAADRAAYERRVGQPIVTPDERPKAVPPGTSYLPATLVSGYPPMDSRGIDLRREVGIAAALGRAISPGGVGATPVATRRDGTRGLFLVAPAPNLIDGVLHPGAVVLFLSEAALRAAARNPAGLRFPPADRLSGDRAGGDTVREEFTVAGQRFAVVMPKASVSGPGAFLPWIILAGGLLLAALAGALGVIAARRARAQRDFDRVFNLSPDLVAVANFDGHFTRVNPAAEQILGYTEEELLTRPYLDLVHPDDRERTAAEAAAIGEGKRTRAFENRYARKDGSYRVLEWTSTPVVEERATYAVARDVTERRKAEAELERLADEQAALSRVATLVAEGAAPTALFDAVAGEMETLLEADQVVLNRFDAGAEIVVLAHRGLDVERTPVGSRVSHEGESVTASVLSTGQPARMEHYEGASGPLAELARETGLRVSVAAPIVVDGRLWGVITASWKGEESPLPDTEERMAHFAELVDTAIANADSRNQLEASRARLVSAGDEARRRVVRDLHDGAQQRLVHTIVMLKLAQRAFHEDDGKAESLVGEALGHAERSNEELRELAHGILPAALSHGGLRAGVNAFAGRLDLSVQVDAPADRFPAEVEESAYFIVAEALTNVVKHSHAKRAKVQVSADDELLRVEVRDDGIGGADRDGHGLEGLGDRATALGGRLIVDSPPGRGTLVAATLPLSAA